MSLRTDTAIMTLKVQSWGPDVNHNNPNPPPLIRRGTDGQTFKHYNIKGHKKEVDLNIKLCMGVKVLFNNRIPQQAIMDSRWGPNISPQSHMYRPVLFRKRITLINQIKQTFCYEPYVFVESFFSEHHRKLLESCLDEGRLPTEEEITSLKVLTNLSQ